MSFLLSLMYFVDALWQKSNLEYVDKIYYPITTSFYLMLIPIILICICIHQEDNETLSLYTIIINGVYLFACYIELVMRRNVGQAIVFSSFGFFAVEILLIIDHRIGIDIGNTTKLDVLKIVFTVVASNYLAYDFYPSISRVALPLLIYIVLLTLLILEIIFKFDYIIINVIDFIFRLSMAIYLIIIEFFPKKGEVVQIRPTIALPILNYIGLSIVILIIIIVNIKNHISEEKYYLSKETK
jgi:hypothetical protein